jgi:hypothetical protein
MSKKQSGKSARVQSKATEKARREALAVTSANLAKIEAAEQPAQGGQVTSPAIDPAAQQVACIDVDPKAEIAAAKKHEQRGKRQGKAKQDQKALPKGAKAPKADKPPKQKRLSALDAAAQVLAKSDGPMTSQALIDAMAEARLWTSPGGKTPAATLYAAMLREITAKGKDARFKKVDRGLFVSAGKGA